MLCSIGPGLFLFCTSHTADKICLRAIYSSSGSGFCQQHTSRIGCGCSWAWGCRKGSLGIWNMALVHPSAWYLMIYSRNYESWSAILLIFRLLGRLPRVRNDWKLLQGLLEDGSSLCLSLCQKSWIYFLHWRENEGNKRSKFSILLYRVSMDCECPQQLRTLQLFNFLEGRDVVYMEIKGL